MKLALVWAATTINMVAVSTFQTPIEILKSQTSILLNKDTTITITMQKK